VRLSNAAGYSGWEAHLVRSSQPPVASLGAWLGNQQVFLNDLRERAEEAGIGEEDVLKKIVEARGCGR